VGFTQDVLRGLIAGAAGTVALNATTYLDMALRGRPASFVPAQIAERTADSFGLELARAGDHTTHENRAEGVGALMGYASGLGYGVLYGVVTARSRGPSVTVGGLGLMLAAMAGANIPAVALGVTDPSEWGAEGWIADIVPHAVYGLVTAAVHDAIDL
jgi:hypothetical protein